MGKVHYSLCQRHEGLLTNAKFNELRSTQNELNAICYLHSFLSPLEKFMGFKQLREWMGEGRKVKKKKKKKKRRKGKTEQL